VTADGQTSKEREEREYPVAIYATGSVCVLVTLAGLMPAACEKTIGRTHRGRRVIVAGGGQTSHKEREREREREREKERETEREREPIHPRQI
jgi:hypothetical protein